jgi:hypothetical protein
MPKVDKGPIIGIVKFRTPHRKQLRGDKQSWHFSSTWANRVDLQIRNTSYQRGFSLRQNLTPFDAAYSLLYEIEGVQNRNSGKEMTGRFAAYIVSIKTQQITFRELQLKTFIEQEMAREVVEG